MPGHLHITNENTTTNASAPKLGQSKLLGGALLAAAIHCACAAASSNIPQLGDIRTPAPVSTIASEMEKVVVFVDDRVPQSEMLLSNLAPDVEIVHVHADEDGLKQIARVLKDRVGIRALHIISHGESGAVLLGNHLISSADLNSHAKDLRTIKSALRANADILLYGCNVAAKDAGRRFLERLSAATGADVAASDDSTGSAARGGNWELEIVAGTVESPSVLDPRARDAYQYVLHTASVNTVAQLKTAIATAATDGADDTITLTSNITFSSAADALTFNVTDGKTLSIVGGGFTLSGNNLARVVDVTGGKVAISNLTIANGFLSGNGGDTPGTLPGLAGGDALGAGIRNAGTLTITSSTISGNKAAGGGGGGGGALDGGGAGGGGGGFGTTAGGIGGSNNGSAGGVGSPGIGGDGAGFGNLRGRGGSTSGGAGGSYGAGYTDGGTGGTANNGSISIGGGGGGGGYSYAGGRGGDAAGAIYNTSAGTLTITSSSITNNIAAGGGGGGGAASGGSGGDGGNAGSGTGAIWNAGGTVRLDSATNATLATGNVGSAGGAGIASKIGSSSGSAGTSTSQIWTTNAGTTDTTYSPPLSASIVVADTALKAGETSLVTITFSEAVTGFTNADLTVANGLLSAVSSSDGGITWTATFTPNAAVTDATNLVTLNLAGVITFASSTAGSGTQDSNNYAIDTARPTASILIADSSLAAGETSLVTITFSEAVTGFTNADLTVANGTLSAVSSSDGGITWTATFTPSAAVSDTANVITLANTGIADAAGNTGTGTTDSNNYAIDTTRPTAGIVIADSALAAGETSLVTVTFSEAVTGFTNADLTVANGTLSAVSSSDGGITWTATFTPSAAVSDATNVITLANTGVADAAGNTGSGTTDSNNYAIDTARPTAGIVVADSSLTAGETSLVTITFSEALTGFTNADLIVANGSLSAVSSSDGGVTWTATLTPTAGIEDTTNVITLDNTGVQDAAGNSGTGTTDSNNYAIDTARPTVSSVSVPANATYGAAQNLDFTVNFDQNVTVNTGGGTPHIALTIGTVTVYASYMSGSGSSALTFRYTVQAGDDDENGVAVAGSIQSNGGTLRDASGNNAVLTLNSVGSTASVLVDALAPAAPSTPDLTSGSDTGISSTDNITSDTTPTFTGTAEAGSSVAVISSVSGTLGTTTADGSGNWSFTSGALSEGAHNITARATDVAGNTSSASAALGITIDTTAPSATNDSASTNEDNSVAISVLANDSDAGSSLNAASVTVGTAPSHGSTSVNTGTGVITYTPTADFNGTDTFTYTVEDLQSDTSAPATVTITVNAVNDAPDAAGDTASTNEDTAVLIDVAANDSDRDSGDAIDTGTLAVASAPNNGTATVQSGQIRYVPAANFNGTDTFTYTIKDSQNAVSAAATVIVNVGSVNDAPSAANDSSSTNEDTAVTVNVLANDSDTDGTLDAASVVVLNAPSNGAATVDTATGRITYTPSADFHGTDSFTYVVRDNGNASSNEATVNITVASVNDAPVALNDTATLQEDVPHSINVLGNDSDVDGTLVPSSVAIVTAPTTGSTSVNATTGAITYTPSNNFNGADSFTYRVRDDQNAWSAPATVILTVQSVNDTPLANDDSATTDEDVPVEIDVLANDSDTDGTLNATTVTATTAPTMGALTVNANGSIIYTPNANAHGTDSFTYNVADNSGGASNTASVSIIVRAINDRPTISGTPTTSLSALQSYHFAPVIADPDNTNLTVSATNLPRWLTLDTATGALTGTPSLADVGRYSGIVLTVSDGTTSVSLAAFAIEVLSTTDSDNDGMPNDFETANGFDPLDPNDGMTDLDRDGVTNRDEYVAGTNPAIDDYPPQLSSPAPVTIDATGLLTRVPTLTPPSAIDQRDGAVEPILVSDEYLSPGTHVLTWRAVDAAGNRGETLQAVNVRPLVSLAKDQVVSEGTTAQIRFLLNGPSPIYPLTVGYSISGTANASDHDLVAGSVVFQDGETEKSIAVHIANDSIAEGTETIEVQLTGPGNFDVRDTQTTRIIESNVAPSVDVTIRQNGRKVSTVTQDGGNITLTATVTDPNPADTHTSKWTFSPEIVTREVSGDVKTLDPSILQPGIYRAQLTVTDNGMPSASVSTMWFINVVSSATSLSVTSDTDEDGIVDATEGLGDTDQDGQPDYADAIALPNVLNEKSGDGNRFLIESDAGVRLTLGAHALAHGADGAQLDSDEIVANGDIPADGVENVGGYFDLMLRDLPVAGASVSLVIPQRRQIPERAFYRKFINGQWINFIQDGNNHLASARGASGVCPPPNSGQYQSGLTAGDWCVRLTLEDGGPNDADGVANATVQDPGGVGAVNVVTTAKRGGGSMGTISLLLLTACYALRYRRMRLAAPQSFANDTEAQSRSKANVRK